MLFRISKEDSPAIYNSVYRYFVHYTGSSRPSHIPIYINFKNPELDDRFQKLTPLENGLFKRDIYIPYMYFLPTKIDTLDSEKDIIYGIPYFEVMQYVCDSQGNLVREYEGRETETKTESILIYLGDPNDIVSYNTFEAKLRHLATDDIFLSKMIGIEKELSQYIRHDIGIEAFYNDFLYSCEIPDLLLASIPETGAICLYHIKLYDIITRYQNDAGGINTDELQIVFRSSPIALELLRNYLETSYSVFKIFSGHKNANNEFRDNIDELLNLLTFSKNTPINVDALPPTLNPLPTFIEPVMTHILSGNIPLYFQVASSIERKVDENNIMAGNDNIAQASIDQCYFIDPMLPFKDIIHNRIRSVFAEITSNIAVKAKDPVIQTANTLCLGRDITFISCNRLYAYHYTGIYNQDNSDGQFKLATLPVHVYYVLLQQLFKQNYSASIDMNIVEFLINICKGVD